MLHDRAVLKKMFTERQHIYGMWTTLSDPSVAELFASILRPDFIAVDMEHTTITLTEAKNIFSVVQANGCSALPRLASHDGVQMKRLLDAGADGVIVPAVNNKQELETIIESLKYMPVGKRGYGIARAHGYGEKFDHYATNWNDSALLIIIIESIEGVNNIEELVSHPEVDGILVGSYDLSGSLNMPGKLMDEAVQKAEAHIFTVCKKYNKSCGIMIRAIDRDALKAVHDKVNFVMLSTDIGILVEWASNARKIINR